MQHVDVPDLDNEKFLKWKIESLCSQLYTCLRLANNEQKVDVTTLPFPDSLVLLGFSFVKTFQRPYSFSNTSQVFQKHDFLTGLEELTSKLQEFTATMRRQDNTINCIGCKY